MARITRSQSAIQLDKGDLKALSDELFKIIDGISSLTKRREIIEEAGKILKEEARSRAPRSEKEHYRYDTPKLSNKLRAPKGSGVKAGTYKPGNIQNSIIDIADRKKKLRTYRVIIGPFYRGWKRKLKSGVYGATERTADGYYAHMIYGSAKAFRREVTGAALQSKRTAILTNIRGKLLKYFREEAAKGRYIDLS